MDKKSYFITGIGTGVGKTIVSALLAYRLQADYWKPVQCGDLHYSDSQLVQQAVSGTGHVYPERYAFKTPVSPHQAASLEKIHVCLQDFELPPTENNLIVEGAGGLFVPLNRDDFMIDLMEHLQLPTILVVRDYLGCINHTFLSIQALRYRKIDIAAVVLNGNFNPYTEQHFIDHFAEVIPFIKIPDLKGLNRDNIQETATEIVLPINF